MRVAVGIHGEDIEKAIESYNLVSLPILLPKYRLLICHHCFLARLQMSERYFTHASPTLFAAGTPNPQMSSCFLVTMKEDSIEGIYDTLKTCAMISKNAGGIGLNVHSIRATGSYIAGTNVSPVACLSALKLR